MKNTYKYYIEDHDELLDDARTFESVWDEKFLSTISEDAAKHHWNHRDGWEDRWPLKFHLYTVDDKDLGIFLVELDYDPVFYAEKVDEDGL
jgi:hypothetical protein